MASDAIFKLVTMEPHPLSWSMLLFFLSLHVIYLIYQWNWVLFRHVWKLHMWFLFLKMMTKNLWRITEIPHFFLFFQEFGKIVSKITQFSNEACFLWSIQVSPGCSTSHALLHLSDMITNALEKRQFVSFTLLDLSKILILFFIIFYSIKLNTMEFEVM